jgi:hypothetical protein
LGARVRYRLDDAAGGWQEGEVTGWHKTADWFYVRFDRGTRMVVQLHPDTVGKVWTQLQEASAEGAQETDVERALQMLHAHDYDVRGAAAAWKEHAKARGRQSDAGPTAKAAAANQNKRRK